MWAGREGCETGASRLGQGGSAQRKAEGAEQAGGVGRKQGEGAKKARSPFNSAQGVFSLRSTSS